MIPVKDWIVHPLQTHFMSKNNFDGQNPACSESSCESIFQCIGQALHIAERQSTSREAITYSLLIVTLVFAQVFVNTSLFGQVIFQNPIIGGDPSKDNPFTSGQTHHPDITVSGIGRGSGIKGQKTKDVYDASEWDSSQFDENKYFTFTLTPIPGKELSMSSFSYIGVRSSTGPTSFALRSSVDNFSANIGTVGLGGTIDLSRPEFQDLTTSIEFRLYGWGATGKGGKFGIQSFSFEGFIALPAPLPVELVFFSARVQEGEVRLAWRTASEINSWYYSVEHSTDGRRFSEVGDLDAAGFSHHNIDYSFNHRPVGGGTQYYRLKMVDLDGTYEYSPVQAVDLGGLTITPPFRAWTDGSQVWVADFQSEETGSFQIIDLQGRLLTATPAARGTDAITSIPMPAVPGGIYLLRWQPASGAMGQTVKFSHQGF